MTTYVLCFEQTRTNVKLCFIFEELAVERAFEAFECGTFNKLNIPTTPFPLSAMQVIADLKSFLDRIYIVDQWLQESVYEVNRTDSSYEKKCELPSNHFFAYHVRMSAIFLGSC
ncbi:hypothetical protein Y032_0285g1348 [Ancylostoma ceylanicum]|uniref:Uncharacterized protein n=1 Tax=Ancylostoma ceylanicum TaxID=53326 RepID=A0A016S6P2_9BILA|nr:hypothetical protein Y032_0285g1348 [Ancylostoma ceylanicum]